MLQHLVVVVLLFPSPLRLLVTKKRQKKHTNYLHTKLKPNLLHKDSLKPVTQNMVHISDALNRPIPIHIHKCCANTIWHSFKPECFCSVTLPLTHPLLTHSSPPLPRFSSARSLLVRSICSRAAGTLLCRVYSLLHCIVCHLSEKRKTVEMSVKVNLRRRRVKSCMCCQKG